jgi:NADH dehydrogenase
MAAHWAAAGHTVSGADLSGVSSPAASVLQAFVPFILADEFPADELTGQDVVLHLAYDRQSTIKINLEGTRRVYRAALEAGVTRQIFVSSYSARPDSYSEYGRLKYELEEFFLQAGQTIVRPGLVIGNGGLFGRNMARILSTRLMPLLDGGRDLLPVIAIEDLAAALTLLLDAPPRAFNLFHPELVTMRCFVETVNQKGRHRAIYVNIPVRWATLALAFAKWLPFRLPVDLDNLRALKQNQDVIHASDLAALLPAFLSFEEMMRRAVVGRQNQRA